MTPAAGALPFHRRLHVRIGAVVLLVLVLMALCLLSLSRIQQKRVDLEVTQRLNLGLAGYIIEHQPGPLLNDAGEPNRSLLMRMAMDTMMTNPAVEVYVLDTAGRIVGHALDGAHVRIASVDLRPVHELLQDRAGAALPLLGDDPSAPGRRNVFSAAMIGVEGRPGQGYLYIVLRGKASQGLMDGPSRSNALRETTLAVLLACAVALMALWAALMILTRPLRRLAVQMQAFRGDLPALPARATGIAEGQPNDAVMEAAVTRSRRCGVPGDEIALVESAARAMQARIAEQFRQQEENDRLRRELISNLSHDLQTPLTSIRGYAEHGLLKNHALTDEERARNWQLILRHSAKLSKRIGDLFELAKLDAARVRPKLESFPLAELLQDVIDGYQLAAQARKVKVFLSRDSRSDARVRADLGLMERVFQNLIDNALRHTPAGGQVRIEVAATVSEVHVSVADTGTGMARERVAQVFERYAQVERADGVDGHCSAGLGLAIVKRILDLHGSAIRVHSEIARGTRFDFSLKRVA
jgi:signal transduction histidine kinase